MLTLLTLFGCPGGDPDYSTPISQETTEKIEVTSAKVAPSTSATSTCDTPAQIVGTNTFVCENGTVLGSSTSSRTQSVIAREIPKSSVPDILPASGIGAGTPLE